MLRLVVKPLRWYERLLDFIMILFMYLAAWSFESPQRTHRWNNKKLKEQDLHFLNAHYTVKLPGKKGAGCRFFFGIPVFHIPILGGWKHYDVLDVPSKKTWHIGWLADDVRGISRILLTGPVRVLIGPSSVRFFAIDAMTGYQIPLQYKASGRAGNGGPFCHLPFL